MILPKLVINEPIFMLLVNRCQSLDYRPDGKSDAKQLRWVEVV